MWCSDCQQDVPAVARSADGPLICTRCEAVFELSSNTAPEQGQVADTGLALEEMDRHHETSSPLSPWDREEMEQRLRRIGQQLRTAYRHDPQFGVSSGLPSGWGSAAQQPPMPRERFSEHRPTSPPQSLAPSRATLATRLISLMLAVGVLGLFGGVAALAWASAFGLEQPWQVAMTATLAAEGTLIVSLAWMAARLWRNSRQLNQQIEGVDRQIRDIEHLTGSLSAQRLSSSQYYYEHFNQGASSHMLLANLRGQIDQLSSRLTG